MKSGLFFLPAASENPAQYNVRSRVVWAHPYSPESFSGSVINTFARRKYEER
jgi:hypothetical protein